MNTVFNLDRHFSQLRQSIVDALSFRRRGHIGAPMSMVEIPRVLFDTFG